MMVGTNPGGAETAKRVPFNSTGIEIGVWKGDTSARFLSRCGFLHMVDAWSVEPYADDPEYRKRYAGLVGGDTIEAFQDYYDDVYAGVVERFGGDIRSRIHRMRSRQFFETYRNVLAADWIYIDGDHSYEGCLEDLRGALTVVEKDGIIYGDDYGNKPGVTRAVNGFLAEQGLDAEIFGGNQFEIRLS